VDVPKDVERPATVCVAKAGGVIAFLPKVAPAAQKPVQAHGAVPVHEVHDARQVIGPGGLDEVMDVAAHDTDRIEDEIEFLQSALDAVQDDLPTGTAMKVEIAVVAPDGDVIAVTLAEVPYWSAHGVSP